MNREGDDGAASAQLLIVSGDSALRVELPAGATAMVGRADDADVCVPDASVSRYHARFTARDGGVVVADNGSHNGTLVNGVRCESEQRLAAGDVVTLGETSIVVQGAKQPPRRVLHGDELSERIDHEVARALEFERALAIVAVVVDPAAGDPSGDQVLGAADFMGSAGDGLWLIGLPEREREEAAEVAQTLARAMPGVRTGVAVCPADGVDSAGLIAAARARAAGGARIEIARALRIGDREVLVADPAMERIYDLLRRLAGGDIPVLIVGETGVGKENAAYAVHAWSARAAEPFVAVNCAAIPDTMVESELFGHARGAFTSADRDKAGYLEAAAGGTVFLDEVGELSPAAQAKLLRVLETRQVTRLGEVRPRDLDFRIVAATNRDLSDTDAFRNDLYFRLSTALVTVPPLRERRREIGGLADAFLPADRRLSAAALRALVSYDWPGNVRELRNAIELAVTTADGSVVEPWHLPERVRDPAVEAEPEAPPADGFRPIAEELQELEKRRMQEALKATGGVQLQAARLLGMPRRTFTLKMRKYGLR